MKTPYDHEYLVKFLLFPLKKVTPVVLAKLIYHDTESFYIPFVMVVIISLSWWTKSKYGL